jgi:long-subunit acyl-CoA synthetase (AMP-forming)
MGMAMANRPTREMEAWDEDTLYEFKTRQGLPIPCADFHVHDEQAIRGRAGESIGELKLRGLWMLEEYMGLLNRTAELFTDDGWLKIDDMMQVSPEGYIKVVDWRKHIVTSRRGLARKRTA